MFDDQISIAVDLLKQGKPIAFPTDTVYALGGDPNSEQAIRSIFALKKRAITQALPVLLPDLGHIYHWIDKESINNNNLKSTLCCLIENFWPGALTIIAKKATTVSNLLTAGSGAVAIRIPNHLLTLQLLKEFNSGIIGTSANQSGQASATNYHQVKTAFDQELFILDGGRCNGGVESTIIELIDRPKIIRQGAIPVEQLAQYL